MFIITSDVIFRKDTSWALPTSNSSILLIEPWHIKSKITSVNIGMINHTFNLLVIINTMYIKSAMSCLTAERQFQ